MAVLLTIAALAFLATTIFGHDAAVDHAQTAGRPINQ
jgi:hypothetical protein